MCAAWLHGASRVSLLAAGARPGRAVLLSPPPPCGRRGLAGDACPAAATMKLTLKTLAGKTFTVEAEESETVRAATEQSARDPRARCGCMWAGRAPRWVQGGRGWGRAAGDLGGAVEYCLQGRVVMCVGCMAAVRLGDQRAAG